MGDWTKNLVAAVVNSVLDTLTSATQAALTWVLGLLSGTVFTSPDVTTLPQVRYISANAALVANTAMVLVVMIAGILAMTHGSVQDRYTVKELLPRLVIGFAAANLATPIVSASISAGNTLTRALTGEQFSSADSFTQIRRVLIDASSDPAMFLVALVLRELVLWMLVLLVITWLGRLSVLLVLASTAPVALACHALPQTEAVARIWWRSLLACLSVQVLQALTLHLAVATLLASDANLPELGVPHDPTGLLNLLIACFLLWLVIRIPKWVARTIGGPAPRGGTLLGSVVRVVAVQQVLRAVGLRGGGLGRRHQAGSATARPAGASWRSTSHVHQHLHVHAPRPDRTRSDPGPAAPSRPTARAHGGRVPVAALPSGSMRTDSRPANPPVVPPGAIPRRRPSWQVPTRPSPTGWPTPPPTPPRPGPTGRPSGTGWPSRLPRRGERNGR